MLLFHCYQITPVNRSAEILIQNQKIAKIYYYVFPEMIALPFCCLNCNVFYRYAYFNLNYTEIITGVYTYSIWISLKSPF